MTRTSHGVARSVFLAALLAALAIIFLAAAARRERASLRPAPVLQLGHSGYVEALAFSPDGRLLASGARDHTVKIWDTRTGELRATLFGHGGWMVSSVAFSPDGQLLASGSNDGSVHVWDLGAGLDTLARVLTVPGDRADVRSVAFSPDGRWLAAGCGEDGICVWDARTGQPGSAIRDAGFAQRVCFTRDSREVGADDGYSSSFWDLRTGRREGATGVPAGYVPPRSFSAGAPDARCFSPDGQTVATDGGASRAGTRIELRDVRTGNRLRTLLMLRGTPDCEGCQVSALAFSDTGSLLASAKYGGGDIFLWEAKTGRLRLTLPGRKNVPCEAVAFSPDGTLLAAASSNGAVRLWNTRSGAPGRALYGRPGTFVDLDFLNGGRTLELVSITGAGAECSWHGHVSHWDPDTGRALPTDSPRAVREWHRRRPERVWFASSSSHRAFSPDGTRVLREDASHKWVLDSLTSAKRQRLEDPGDDGIEWPCFSPDGRLIIDEVRIRGNSFWRLCLWDGYTGALMARLSEHYYGIADYRFSPDATRLASAGLDGRAKLWDTRTLRELATRDYQGPVKAVAFSPDGRLLVSGGSDLKICDGRTGRLLATLVLTPSMLAPPPRASARVEAPEWLAYTPDGSYDGSPGAERLLRWRVGDRLFPPERYARASLRPGLMAAVLRGPE